MSCSSSRVYEFLQLCVAQAYANPRSPSGCNWWFLSLFLSNETHHSKVLHQCSSNIYVWSSYRLWHLLLGWYVVIYAFSISQCGEDWRVLAGISWTELDELDFQWKGFSTPRIELLPFVPHIWGDDLQDLCDGLTSMRKHSGAVKGTVIIGVLFKERTNRQVEKLRHLAVPWRHKRWVRWRAIQGSVEASSPQTLIPLRCYRWKSLFCFSFF